MSRPWPRFMLSTWFQRGVMGLAIAANIWNLSYEEMGSVWWWLALGVTAFMVVGQVFIEINRRAFARFNEEMKWQLAAESDDPITALALTDYLDTLSAKQIQSVSEWLRTHTPEDLPHAPPEVLGFLRVAQPPREGG